MLRIVADIGNSRLKWARLGPSGTLGPSTALPLDDEARWADVWDEWHKGETEGSSWAVSTVNPPLARRLEEFLSERSPRRVQWFLTAAEVPVPKDVEGADTGGSDRAFAVLAASRLLGTGKPALVVSCGTAITVERINAEGVWQGGAIAMGLGLCARALHKFTAQLPLVAPDATAPSWGRGTVPSLEAGVFWGTVGAVRELIDRQKNDLGADLQIVWTGGDADRLASSVEGPSARIVQDLVLQGVVQAAFDPPHDL